MGCGLSGCRGESPNSPRHITITRAQTLNSIFCKTVCKRRHRWYEDSQSYADISLTMAEAALCGFKNDPRFPYEAIAEHLSWIPNYIDELTPLHNPRGHMMYHCLINILLV